jgi:hypothetical protein
MDEDLEAMDQMDEDDGYPTQEALDKIVNWRGNFIDLMTYVKSIWWMPDWGWHLLEGPEVTLGEDSDYVPTQYTRMYYKISTGGWSGNEDIIEALQKNPIFWSMCWQSSRRGGHYEFDVLESKEIETRVNNEPL